jgi:hypothetical protein
MYLLLPVIIDLKVVEHRKYCSNLVLTLKHVILLLLPEKFVKETKSPESRLRYCARCTKYRYLLPRYTSFTALLIFPVALSCS